ncbi:MAG: hypothetical protein ACK4P3_08370 [Fimbriimonadaceae bacterium]
MLADMHILFDRGMLTVTPDYRVRVSPKPSELYVNGRLYTAFEGSKLGSLPSEEQFRPSREMLAWHEENQFVKQ